MPKGISKTLTVVAAALAAATLAASYGPGYSGTNTSPRNHVVEIRDFKFTPSALTIRQGDTIEWINRDIVPHTATGKSSGWDTQELITEQSGRITFSSAGTGKYICLFHPNMRGEITITVK